MMFCQFIKPSIAIAIIKVNAIAIIQARLAPKKYGTQKIGLGQDQDAAALRIEVCYVETNTAEAE